MKRAVYLHAEYYRQSNYQGSVYTWNMDGSGEILMSLPDGLWVKKKRELDREADRASDFYAAQRERDDSYEAE